MSDNGFLAAPDASSEIQALFDGDLDDVGYVMNVSRLWAYQPATVATLFDLMGSAFAHSGLTFRQRAILVAATASTLGDSYCSLAWGTKLSGVSDEELASSVLLGEDNGLTPNEHALADWARTVVRDPNSTGTADVQRLRDSGLSDAQIFAVTTFVALRLAFSTVNDALGARPDMQLGNRTPPAVRAAVHFGRPVAEVAS